jgi:hypothetical protein
MSRSSQSDPLISGNALSNAGSPPALRIAIDAYLKKRGIQIKPSYEVDNLAGAMSLIHTTGSVALLPAYAKNPLSGLITSRPLRVKFRPSTFVSAISRAMSLPY